MKVMVLCICSFILNFIHIFVCFCAKLGSAQCSLVLHSSSLLKVLRKPICSLILKAIYLKGPLCDKHCTSHITAISDSCSSVTKGSSQQYLKKWTG